MSKYGVDKFAERLSSRSVSAAKKEDRIIKSKLEQIDKLDSRGHFRQSRDKQKVNEEVAHTLPLECWGVVELVKVRDVRTGAVFRVNRCAVNEFIDNHPRPHDLVVE